MKVTKFAQGFYCLKNNKNSYECCCCKIGKVYGNKVINING